jgi:hypothetical protein
MAAAEKYQAALKRLAGTRDEIPNSASSIIPGEVVMRSPLNRKSKIHPRWDGPFVVLDTSDKDVYQLGTANGHILENLVNKKRLRKLDEVERTRYSGEFWTASSRLRSRNERARRKKELHDIDVRLKEAILESRELSNRCIPSPLGRIAELSAEKKKLETELRSESSTPPKRPASPLQSGREKRSRRAPFRYRDT